MAWLLCIACVLVCCPELLQGKASGKNPEPTSLITCVSASVVSLPQNSGKWNVEQAHLKI